MPLFIFILKSMNPVSSFFGFGTFKEEQTAMMKELFFLFSMNEMIEDEHIAKNLMTA